MVVDVASIFCMSANQELVNGGGSRGFGSRDETISSTFISSSFT